MLIKNSQVLYLWDFDGTLFGDNSWVGLWRNNKACLTKGPYINPGEYDIRWSILTGRPRIDKFFIWFVCNYNGLHPEIIYTLNRWFYPKVLFSTFEIYKYKLNVMKNIIDKKIRMFEGIEKIFYMDNDLDCISYINSNRDTYPIQCISVFDFKQENFSVFL